MRQDVNANSYPGVFPGSPGSQAAVEEDDEDRADTQRQGGHRAPAVAQLGPRLHSDLAADVGELKCQQVIVGTGRTLDGPLYYLGVSAITLRIDRAGAADGDGVGVHGLVLASASHF